MIDLRHGDCLELMKELPDKSIDLVVTSPPYDNLRTYNGTLNWSFEIFKPIAKELSRVLKDGGVIVWVVGDATNNGSETGTSFKQALYFKEECGLNLHDTMIWQKTNPMPKVKTKRYFDCFEYMFVFSKGKPSTFNPIMVDCKMGGKTYNSTVKNIGGEHGRTKKEFVLNNQRYKNNIWEIAIAQNKTEHPAVFPFSLVVDHITTWSNENDTILDPFMGSGTTGVACVNTGRKFIGIELDDGYFEIAKQRIESA